MINLDVQLGQRNMAMLPFNVDAAFQAASGSGVTPVLLKLLGHGHGLFVHFHIVEDVADIVNILKITH